MTDNYSFPVFAITGTPPTFVHGWARVDVEANIIAGRTVDGREETTWVRGGSVRAIAELMLRELVARPARGGPPGVAD